MKKYLGAILLGTAILMQPITVQANGLSRIPTEDATGIPTEIMQYAEIVGNEFNICPELLESIAYQESRYTETATNGTCKGLMQINTAVHKDRFIDAGWSTSDWSNGYKSMYVAAEYLGELFEEYEDVAVVLYMYNGDATSLKKYYQTGYLSEYVEEILTRSEELEREHGK